MIQQAEKVEQADEVEQSVFGRAMAIIAPIREKNSGEPADLAPAVIKAMKAAGGFEDAAWGVYARRMITDYDRRYPKQNRKLGEKKEKYIPPNEARVVPDLSTMTTHFAEHKGNGRYASLVPVGLLERFKIGKKKLGDMIGIDLIAEGQKMLESGRGALAEGRWLVKLGEKAGAKRIRDVFNEDQVLRLREEVKTRVGQIVRPLGIHCHKKTKAVKAKAA
jgi:hypothetical protein